VSLAFGGGQIGASFGGPVDPVPRGNPLPTSPGSVCGSSRRLHAPPQGERGVDPKRPPKVDPSEAAAEALALSAVAAGLAATPVPLEQAASQDVLQRGQGAQEALPSLLELLPACHTDILIDVSFLGQYPATTFWWGATLDCGGLQGPARAPGGWKVAATR